MRTEPIISSGKLASVTNYKLDPTSEGGRRLTLHEGQSAPLLWISGGGTFVVEGRYVVLIERDDLAPTNPGKLTVATGVSDNEMEWERPSLLLRELFEELIVLRDGTQLVPSGELAAFVSVAIAAREALGIECSIETQDWSQLSENYRDEVVTKEESLRGILSLDPLTGGVNLMWVIGLDEEIESLRFLDGEITSAGVALRRNIYFYDLSTSRILNQQLKTVTLPPQLTFHAEVLLTALKKTMESSHG